MTTCCPGDAAAEAIGVVADPEIASGSVSADTPFIVLASDGVFEFMQDQTVVDLVCPCMPCCWKRMLLLYWRAWQLLYNVCPCTGEQVR